ncbi:torsin-1A-like isoform X1 [Lampetra fluviatilis]
MRNSTLLLLLLLPLLLPLLGPLPCRVGAFEPVVTTLAVATASALTCLLSYSGPRVACWLGECCSEPWIQLNVTVLKEELDQQLFGQHLVHHVVFRAMGGYATNPSPQKALALSFHGWTGTGKNFVSNIIAKSLFLEGQKSNFVHTFVATVHFPHAAHVDTYKEKLQGWIRGNVTACKHSVFVFDEMDKMHPGLIDAIKPFLDYYPILDGVDYRHAIFIFLSNAGGNDINEVALRFWNEGRKREEIVLADTEKVLTLRAFNDKNSGFWHASLIDKHLIDFFVPFLPLEHRHVRMCARAVARSRGVQLLDAVERVAKAVADEMAYFPENEGIFSVTGCKSVAQKVEFHL